MGVNILINLSLNLILQYRFQLNIDGKSSSQATKRNVEPTMETHAEEEIDLDIAKLVQKKQETDPSFTETSEEPMKIHIWDFAGQELYYTTHQVLEFQLVKRD